MGEFLGVVRVDVVLQDYLDGSDVSCDAVDALSHFAKCTIAQSLPHHVGILKSALLLLHEETGIESELSASVLLAHFCAQK